MKVLWLSNKLLSADDAGSAGVSPDAMAETLVASGEVILGNITFGPVKEIVRRDSGPVCQWIIPNNLPIRNGLPPARQVSAILNAVDSFSPDLVHVWGTEHFWGLLTARKYLSRPALLEIQGLKSAIAPVFFGGLTFREQLSCTGLNELAHRRSIFQIRRRYELWGRAEREIISGHTNISTLLTWALPQVKAADKPRRLFPCGRILRKPFYQEAPYAHLRNHKVFCLAKYSAPFKGLHVAIRAVSLLRKRFSDIELRIAGVHPRSGIRRDGYISWIDREIDRLGLQSG
ncbi:MAG: hypothetical protein ACYC9O_20240, partial [Candidatus Latescibacterota bacterium]